MKKPEPRYLSINPSERALTSLSCRRAPYGASRRPRPYDAFPVTLSAELGRLAAFVAGSTTAVNALRAATRAATALFGNAITTLGAACERA